MNNEFVSVPLELAQRVLTYAEAYADESFVGVDATDLIELRALLAQPPAQPPAQHQGEPVAWRIEAYDGDIIRKSCLSGSPFTGKSRDDKEWAVICQVRSIPLYTRADIGEVERLREELKLRSSERDKFLGWCRDARGEAVTLRAQLAERDALLDHMAYYLSPALASHQYSMTDETMHHALSVLNDWRNIRKTASAEPSAPIFKKCNVLKECNVRYSSGSQGYIDPNRMDQAGEPRAPFEMQPLGKEFAQVIVDNFDDLVLKSDAPVERDERAEFEVVPALGFPSYSVSRDGVVYRNDSGNVLSQQANSKGYLTVNMSEQGKSTRRTVHRVVLESFVGVRPDGFQALHSDGNPANNRLSNLRWGEPSENEADKALHGTKAIGSRNGAARLTGSMVQEILEAKRAGGKKWGAGILAKKFGVDISTVTRAARGVHWLGGRAALERKS